MYNDLVQFLIGRLVQAKQSESRDVRLFVHGLLQDWDIFRSEFADK